jgi:hypothetical protein
MNKYGPAAPAGCVQLPRPAAPLGEASAAPLRSAAAGRGEVPSRTDDWPDGQYFPAGRPRICAPPDQRKRPDLISRPRLAPPNPFSGTPATAEP